MNYRIIDNNFKYGKNKRKLFKINYIHYFESKRYIITMTELRYYKDLLKIAEKYDLILLTKVSIYDIVRIKDTLYKKIALYQCDHETIDFVFVDKKDCRIRICVQLDDPYITNKRKLKRRQFIIELFKILDINLIRLKITDEYNIENIENKIRNILSEPMY